jgi:hypothetical protein
MRPTTLGSLLIVFTVALAPLGCDPEAPPPEEPPPVAGSGGSGGGRAGGGGNQGGSGGGTAGTGGAAGTGGSAGSGATGRGAAGTGGATPPAPTPPDAAPPPPAEDAGARGPDAPPSAPPGPTAPGQGPTAMGRIVFAQDFEMGQIGSNGFTLSPNGLPPERMQIVDDPLGQRGKVVRAIWQNGDNFRTSAGTEPRSWLSNARGYQIEVGTKISLAWGMQWTNVNMNAFFAQTIGPGPVWELRVRGDGTFNVLCNKCGGNTDHGKIQPNRWYDFRVDMDWQNGGTVRFFMDGQMVRQATMSGASAACHWDGGIYWSRGSAKSTRTVYISNLSVGVR